MDKTCSDDFHPTEQDLAGAMARLLEARSGHGRGAERAGVDVLPHVGLGASAALDLTATISLDQALGFHSKGWFAHMDPPTPWVTWMAQAWCASINQNLLHPDTGQVGRDVEARVVKALAPHFGMGGGHMVPGSTLANLTALWAAREVAGITRVVTSDQAHLSVSKAAHILGLSCSKVRTDRSGRIDHSALGDLGSACLVLTAGTTSTGAVDQLLPRPDAAWVHVDAAWAGPLRLSPKYAPVLDGLEKADSVAISAHKWLWQPKDSALILFADAETAHEALSFGGAYLSAPNIGVMGSSAARAVPLAATLMAFGLDGIAHRLEACMSLAERFADLVSQDPEFELWAPPETGVVAWRPTSGEVSDLRLRLADRGIYVSQTKLNNEDWLRSVAIHPGVDVDAVYQASRG